jgi:hypothetical protein
MFLLDSQDNYKAAVSSTFQSSANHYTNQTLPNKKYNISSASTLIRNTNSYLTHQDSFFNNNRTRLQAKLLLNYLLVDLPLTLVEEAFNFAELSVNFVDECSFNLKLCLLLIVILGFILVSTALSWKLLSKHILNFDFKEFYNRKEESKKNK